MLTLKAKFLEARELPASDPYPPSGLVSVLAGTETLHLTCRPELLAAFNGVPELTEVELDLRYRRIDLAAVSNAPAKGKAYRLSVAAAQVEADR